MQNEIISKPLTDIYFPLKFRYLTFLTPQVLIPKGAYKGQKLIKLVNKKTPANTKRTIPTVPVIIPVKYNTAIIAATIALMIRSEFPIFFFMMLYYN